MRPCKHTFALRIPCFSGRYCSCCLSPPLSPKIEVYQCASCGTVVHQGCLKEFLDRADKSIHQNESFKDASGHTTTTEAISKKSTELWTSFREFMQQQQLALTVSNPLGSGVPLSWSFASFFSGRERPLVPHRHRMMPSRFFLRTPCGQCLASSNTQEENSDAEAQSVSSRPKDTFLGFGDRGYCCVTCNYALHPECLRALDPSLYEMTEDPVSDTEDTLLADTADESNENKTASPTDADGISPVIRFITTRIFHSKDPNTMLILRDFMALLQRFSNRHPSIGITSLNPYSMATISRRDTEMYKLSCDGLGDADFVLSEGSEGPTMKLLRELMRFSTAVYGQAYKSGYLSSVAGGLACRSIRRDILYTDEVTNNKAVMDILALPKVSLVMSRWSHNALEPNYCIFVDHETQRIILAFRGTLSDGDLLSDLCPYGDPFADGHAHQGAARIVAAMFDHRSSSSGTPSQSAMEHRNDDKDKDKEKEKEKEKEEEKEKENKEEGKKGVSQLYSPTISDDGIDAIVALTKRYPDYKIFVTGHSLGGGVALLFGVRAIRENIFGDLATQRMRVVAFAPMPVLSMPEAQSYEDQLWSVVNGCDVVCRLQLNAVDRLAAEISREAVVTSDDTADLTEEMHHPGRVFMLTTPWDMTTNRMVEVPRGHFVIHHMFISSSMIRLHFMDSYTASLQEVHLRTP